MKQTILAMSIESYCKVVDYLVNDIYNLELKADIKQDMLLYLFELFIQIENKRKLIKDIESYVFISLKNKKSSLLKDSRYKIITKLENIDLVPSITIQEDSEYNYLVDNLDVLIIKTLSSVEQSIVNDYYYNDLTMSEIGIKNNVSQQAISKRLDTIKKKLKRAYIKKTNK